MIYVAVYHPLKSLEPKKISGQALIKTHFQAKVTLDKTDDKCKTIDLNIKNIRDVLKNHEQW